MRAPYKRAMSTTPKGDPLPGMRDAGATMKGKMGKVETGSGKPMMGPKTTSTPSGKGITSQGDVSGGMNSGRSRTNTGRNTIGKGRQQSM